MLDRAPTWQSAAAAFALYLLASVVLIGHGAYAHFGSTTIGYGADPPIFVWSLEWWPRAILDGLDLLHPYVVYAPEGFNGTLITSIPGPSLAMAPLTLLAGPLISYNVLAILIPAVNGWAMYLLCRAAGARSWPSLAGGYLFGFSSYVLAQSLGHPNLSLVAMAPLAVYLVLRRRRGAISTRAFVAAMTAVLVFQFLTSTEVFLTMALLGAAVFAVAIALLAAERRELLSLAKWTLLAYALTGIVVLPYLIAFFGANQSFSHFQPSEFATDPLNLVIPTRITEGGGRLASLGDRFGGNLTENGAYFGIPLLAALALFAWQGRRQRTALLLLAAFAIALLASLGPRLVVLGTPVGPPLPWEALTHLPLTRYVLPQRLIVFAWLPLALIVALWLSQEDRMRPARWALVLVGLALLLPNRDAVDPSPGVPIWSSARALPPLFADGEAALFRERPNLLVLPYDNGESTYWQANAEMAFAMPGGYVSGTPPVSFSCWPPFGLLQRERFSEIAPAEFFDFLAAKRVDAVVAFPSTARAAAPLLDRIGTPWRRAGGMIVIAVPPRIRSGEPLPECPVSDSPARAAAAGAPARSPR